jgi:arylsulfatase I/J
MSAVAAQVAYSQQPDGGSYFFDLTKDPLESNNLFYTDNEKYSVNKFKMINKLSHWAAKVVAPDAPDEGKKKSKWKRAGGITPWLDDTTTREISQIYTPNNPPNIVFILVDDWGWNDVGYQSTYLNFTTPTIDRLASEGIKLTNYWTSPLCTPSRGALMTGKYAFRLGLSEERSGGELPLSEATIAEELKSAGYRTYMVGKWHLGMSSYARTPTYRGFDYFYGYYNGFVDYWSKTYSGFLDLQNNDQLETDPDATSSSLHNGYLMTQKAVNVIEQHAIDNKDDPQPFFLYFASQLIHEDWAAPMSFIERCLYPGVTVEQSVYCGMNLMLDESVSNITCALANNGFAENTIIVIASDNGGVSSMPGNSFPFKGSKGSYFRGGLSAAAFIHGSPIPTELRGTSYDGEMHVTGMSTMSTNVIL